MSFSENAIISIRNNARLRRERTFLNTENNETYVSAEEMILTDQEKKKLENAAKRRDRSIYLYYLIMLVLSFLIFGYIVVFEW